MSSFQKNLEKILGWDNKGWSSTIVDQQMRDITNLFLEMVDSDEEDVYGVEESASVHGRNDLRAELRSKILGKID